MTLAFHDPNRGSVKVGSYASKQETWLPTVAIDVPHFVRLDPTGKRFAFFDSKSSRIDLRSDSGSRSIAIKGIRDKVHQFRWLKNARGFVVVTHNKAYVGFLKSESQKTITFKPLLPKFGNVSTWVRTTGTGVVARIYHGRQMKVFFIPIDGLRARAPQRVASQFRTKTVSILAGNRIVVTAEPEEFRAPDRFLIFDTEGGKLRLTDTMSAPKYIKNWATGSRSLAYIASSDSSASSTLFIHSDKLVKARLPREWWEQVPILWASKDDSRYLIGSNYQPGLWNQKGERMWSWSPPKGRQLTSANFAPDGSIIASAGLQIYRVKDGKGKLLLRVKARNPERLQRDTSDKAYSFVDQPVLTVSGKIAYSLVHVDRIFR